MSKKRIADEDDPGHIKSKRRKTDSMADSPMCQISLNFTQRLNIGETEHVWGVTKLQNEIYVLCDVGENSSSSTSPPCQYAILVFEDRIPFRQTNKIDIDLMNPRDLRASEMENCLYCSDQTEGVCTVWKITREFDGKHKIIKWLNTYFDPMSLSVSRDGLLLMVSRNDSSYLETYGSDAKLLRSIKLPSGIKNPIHVVETSNGNFIILHEWLEKKGESSRRTRRVWSIWEVTADGQPTNRRFSPSNKTQNLMKSEYLAIDSENRVFVADTGNRRVILLDSDLQWNRILCPTGEDAEEEIENTWPEKLCYDEEEKQLIVGGDEVINIYTTNLQRPI